MICGVISQIGGITTMTDDHPFWIDPFTLKERELLKTEHCFIGMGGDRCSRRFVSTSCGPQTHLLIRSDVRSTNFVLQYASSALDKSCLYTSIANTFSEFLRVQVGNFIRAGTKMLVKLEIGTP